MITKTPRGWQYDNKIFSSLEDAVAAQARDERQGARRFSQSEQAEALFSAGRKSLRMAVPRSALGNLRGIANPVKTPMAGPRIVAGGAGTVSGAVTVQQTIPAGAVLFVENLAAGETLDNVTIDGQNIFTNGALPASSVNPAIVNTEAAPGVLLTRPVTQQLAVVATVGGAKTIAVYVVAPSVEVEQALDSACQC